VGTSTELGGPARRVERMLNATGVEGVLREVGLRRGEAQLLLRHEPEEVAALAADRAAALDDLLDVPLHLEPDPSAMTSALIGHGRTPLQRIATRQAKNRPSASRLSKSDSRAAICSAVAKPQPAALLRSSAEKPETAWKSAH